MWISRSETAKRDRAALAHEDAATPGPGVPQRGLPRRCVPRAVDRDLAAETTGRLGDRVGQGVRVADADVDQAQVLRQAHALHRRVEADDGGGAHRTTEHRRGEPHRPEARDEQSVAAAHLRPQQPLVGRAEAAGDEGAVDEREGLREQEAGRLLGEEVVGMASVALPPVRGAEGGVAPHGIPATALVAHPAAGDVVDDDAVADAQSPSARPHVHDLTTGLVAGDHALVGLGAVPEVLTVDRPDVAAADGRRAHPQQHLPRSGFGHLGGDVLDRAVPGEADPLHRGHAASLPSGGWAWVDGLRSDSGLAQGWAGLRALRTGGGSQP